MRWATIVLAGSLFATTFASSTTAQVAIVNPDPEIINWGGVAFSWPKGDRKKYKPGDPIFVYDVVSALDEQTLTDADCTKWQAEYKGAIWCFANHENRDKFVKSIDKEGESLYEPLYGGRCALGSSWGMRSPAGDPRTFEVIEYHGETRIVVQSHNKWRAEFRAEQKENLNKASLAQNIYTSLGAIVPNASLKKSQ